MAGLLYKLGSSIAKHKWWGIAIWVVLLVAIVTPLTLNSPQFDDDIEMNGLTSLDTNDKIRDEFNLDSEKASIRIVFHSNSVDGITKEDTKNDIQKTLDEIKKNDDYVGSITDPYLSGQVNDDETTAFADINYVVAQTSFKNESLKNVKSELDDLKNKHNLQTELTGNALTDIEIGGAAEVIGVAVAFVILFITFGSLIAAGMPMISALLGLGSSIGIIALLTFVFDIPNITLTLAVMIGLAVGIDYALFILSRYRQIAKTETNHIKAIGLAVGTAGSAVVFAGITVIIAVSGLSLIGIDFLAVMGFASAISVLVAVISALTLLPALISVFHKRIQPKPSKAKNKDSIDTPWSKLVVGKPILAITIGLIILIVASLPMSHMRLGIPDDGMKPDNTTEKKAYDLISDEFSEGFNGQIAMLVNVKGKNDQNVLERDLDKMTDDIKDFTNVDIVAPPQLNENGDYALVGIIPKEGPNANSTNELVHELRDYKTQAQDQYDFDTEISGQSVINIDMSEKLNDAIPIFAGVIIALAFVLLMVVFRSIIIPLKAVLGFLLSLTATLGFTTLIMQDGFMGGVFGVDTPGPLLAFLPVIVIGLLFGLAIDYEIFLMSRIHEEYRRTQDNVHSIKVGIKESGPVIVAAALIMFTVFISFVFQDDVMIKSMGIALAFGVLFDAFIVRMTLIPALTKLFGTASWYMPKWLNTLLPKVDIEGHGLQSEPSSPSNEETFVDDDGLLVIEDPTNRESYNEYTSTLTNSDMDFEALNNTPLDNESVTSDPESEQEINDFELLKLLKEKKDNVEKIQLLNEQKRVLEDINEVLEKVIERKHW